MRNGRGFAEAWLHCIGRAADVARAAVAAEHEGWDGALLPGSPLLTADPWVTMALAARETSRIRFGTGVATPAPQTAAALAGSAATVQQAFHGRVVLGLGRGDRAAASLGMAPMPVGHFERYVARVQGYLRGDNVPFDIEFDGGGLFPSIELLEVSDAPTVSRFGFFMEPDDTPKVPLDVFAAGPKVIGIGARHADRITFSVGADPARVHWAIATAHAAIEEVGRDPGDVEFGAMITVCAHDDVEVARGLVAGAVASAMRFSTMHGAIPDSVPETDRAVYRAVHEAQTRDGHFANLAPHANGVTAEFIDRFAVIGPVAACVARLEELVALGINRIAFGFPGLGAPGEATEEARLIRTRIVEAVIPELRARVGVPTTGMEPTAASGR